MISHGRHFLFEPVMKHFSLINVLLTTCTLSFATIPSPELWPERVTVTADVVGAHGEERIEVREGSTFVLIRAEGDSLFLSGRINAVKVPIESTDFMQRVSEIESSDHEQERGLVNGLLTGRLRFLDGDAFRPVQVKDSDRYTEFLFVYLDPESSETETVIPLMKSFYEQNIAPHPERVMVMFSNHGTPDDLYEFVFNNQIPWKTVVFHMAPGYREAFQHGVSAPALVLSSGHGDLKGKWELSEQMQANEVKVVFDELAHSLAER